MFIRVVFQDALSKIAQANSYVITLKLYCQAPRTGIKPEHRKAFPESKLGEDECLKQTTFLVEGQNA